MVKFELSDAQSSTLVDCVVAHIESLERRQKMSKQPEFGVVFDRLLEQDRDVLKILRDGVANEVSKAGKPR